MPGRIAAPCMHMLRCLLVLSMLCAATVAQVVAYHDVSATSHQTQFTTLAGQGYRLTQLSVAGGLSAPRYSAIWEQAAGPAWVSMSGLTPTQYVTQRATWLGQGYRPKLLTTAGSGSNAVVATMFVADGVGFADYIGISASTFQSHCDTQRNNGRRLVSADIYGSATTPLYAAVFENNTSDTVWGYVLDDNPTDFAATFAAFYEVDARLAALGMSEDQRYVSVWHDDRVGAWAARSNYSTSGWQTQFNTLTGAGYSPLVIASGGVGSLLRFAGAFAQYRTPRTRTFTTTGQVRAEFNGFDAYMTGLVQSTGARNASIAIAKSGRLVYARGYTWGESGTAITQPTSLFRMASVSKVPTAMAIQKLVANGVVSLSSKPATLLGVAGAGTNWGNVTLQHCLEYTSGLPRDFDHVACSVLANPTSPTLPVTLGQAVNWMAAHSSLFPPGSYGNYTNNSFMLAGRVIEHLTGQSQPTWLQNNIYTPLGISRFRVAAGLPQNLFATELRGYAASLYLKPSVYYTDQRRKAPQWAGNPQLTNATGGLAGSTVDCVRLLSGVFGLGSDWITHPPIQQSSMLARHSVTALAGPDGLDQVTPGAFSWLTQPNGVHVYNKSGTLEDASTRVMWRSDGVAIAVFVNKGSSWADDTSLNQLVDAMTSWPNDDLFAGYGLPSFPQRPALTSVNVQVLPNVTNTPFVVTGERLDTVTAVHIGPHTILNTTSANWHLGWFRVLSPLQMEVYPPQGVAPLSFTAITASNPVGTSSGVLVAIQNTIGSVAVAAPPTVTPLQSFRVYCGSGTTPNFGVLTISTSNLPSVAPGVVSLGIGNQFSDLLVTDFQLIDPTSRSAWWQIPPLPWPGIYVQTAVFDPVSAQPLPLPASTVRQVVRQ